MTLRHQLYIITNVTIYVVVSTMQFFSIIKRNICVQADFIFRGVGWVGGKPRPLQSHHLCPISNHVQLVLSPGWVCVSFVTPVIQNQSLSLSCFAKSRTHVIPSIKFNLHDQMLTRENNQVEFSCFNAITCAKMFKFVNRKPRLLRKQPEPKREQNEKQVFFFNFLIEVRVSDKTERFLCCLHPATFGNGFKIISVKMNGHRHFISTQIQLPSEGSAALVYISGQFMITTLVQSVQQISKSWSR